MARTPDLRDIGALQSADAGLGPSYPANVRSFNNHSFNSTAITTNYDNRVDNSHNVVTNNYHAAEAIVLTQRMILKKWLGPLDFGPAHCRNLGNWQSGTGQWLMDDPQFIGWEHGEHRTLLCEGIRMYNALVHMHR